MEMASFHLMKLKQLKKRKEEFGVKKNKQISIHVMQMEMVKFHLKSSLRDFLSEKYMSLLFICCIKQWSFFLLC